MSKKWLIALACTLVFAPASWALGLGEIEIKSKLNQPLDAEIEITSASRSELDNVVFSIPNADAFARYNLDRPQILSSVRFVVENRGATNKVIRLSSSQVVTDPFLTFLIQADWPQGRMLREYTVLVDPPLYVPTDNTVDTNAYVDGAEVNTRLTTNSQGSISGRDEGRGFGNATGTTDYTNFASTAITGDNYRVKRGDTLWEIANSISKNDSFTVNQTMMAIFRSNPEAFEGNINRLKAGQVLSVPTRNQIADLTEQSANQAVRSQTRDWRDNTRDYESSAAGNNSSSLDNAQAGTSENSEGRLELKVPDLESEPDSASLEIDADGLGADAADQQMVNELQAKVDEFERLLSAKDNELASLQQELANAREEAINVEPNSESETAESETAESPSGELESENTTDTRLNETEPDKTSLTEVEPETPATTEPPKVETETPVISTSDDGGLFSLLKKLALGLGLALIGLLGFLFFKNRRKGPSHDTLFVDEDLDNTVEDIAERIKTKIGNKYGNTSEVEQLSEEIPGIEMDGVDASSDDDLDFDFGSDDAGNSAPITETIESDEALPFDDTTLADVSMGTMDVDSNDPIAETDFHMAYGLYDQAADIMSSAITETDNFEFKEKLLEVFFVSGNKEEFTRYAAEIKDEALAKNPSTWENIIIMGKQIAPDEALFSGDVSTAGIDEGLDFSLSDTGQVEVDQSLFADLEEASVSDADTDIVDLDFSEEPETLTDDLVNNANDDVLDISLNLELPEAPVDLEGVIEDFGTDLDASLEIAVDESAQTSLQEKLDQIPDADATKEIDVSDFLDLDIGEATGIVELPELESEDSNEISDDAHDDTLDFSFDISASDDLADDNLGLDLADETQNLADEFLDKLDINGTRTQEMKFDENFDLLLDDNDDTSANELDLDLETLLSDGVDPFPDDTKRSMLPDGVNESDTGTMSLQTLEEDNKSNVQKIEDVLNPDDTHASTAQITDEELAAMGLSDDGPEMMSVTGLSFDDADDVDEVSTKLDLARAYIEMDDPDNAKSILQEVIEEGNSAQQTEARDLIGGL